MTKTKTKYNLTKLLLDSQAVKLLIPAEQQALFDLAKSSQFALKKALQTILIQEKPDDPRSLEFTEITLEGFIRRNLPPIDQQLLHTQSTDKAIRLLRTFLFFQTPEKEQLITLIPGLTQTGLDQLISTLREGHRKQTEYLTTFAEKDPKMAIKFEVLASGQFIKNNQSNQK
jgi:hypothetical protein